MKKFKNYSDHELIQAVKVRVAEERAATCDLLDFLFEIQSRMLFAAIGFSSLHEFCVRELGYSDGAAYRRISAMKLSRELPVAKSAIEDGTLSLTTASTLQTFFDRERKAGTNSYSPEQKSALVEELQGKSRTECEKKLAEISPQAFPQEKARVLSGAGDTEIRFVASAALMKKIDQLKKFVAHRTSGSSHADLMECLVDLGLKTWNPEKPSTQRARRKSGGTAAAMPEAASLEKLEQIGDSRVLPNPFSLEKLATPPASRYIARQDRNLIWQRDRGHCTFIDTVTKRACASSHGLQIDHIIPFAKGGASEPGNLRLLCRAHNVLSARRSFGRARSAVPVRP